MAEIDDELIDNLREGIAAHMRHGETAPLLSAALEITGELGPVITAAQARKAGRCRDRDGDVWTPGQDGLWYCETEGYTLEAIQTGWGPLREVRDDGGA